MRSAPGSRPGPARRAGGAQAFDVVVLGDLNPDLVLSGPDVEPSFGQAERLVEAADLTIGGSAAIFACGAARLGLRTAIVGVVGDDLFGRFMLDALSARDVDTAAVAVDRSERTGLSVILSRPEDRAILTFPGAIAALRERHIDRDLLRGARHVHVASYFLQPELGGSLAGLFQEARAAGASTSVDPNWDPRERWDGGLRELLRHTDVFLPNAQEALRISGRDAVGSAAAALAANGPLVAVKLGAGGAVAVRGGYPPATFALRPLGAIDTTGAGDSFDAGFVHGQLSGGTVEQSLSLACACGALSTRARGGTAAQPSLEEARRLASSAAAEFDDSLLTQRF